MRRRSRYRPSRSPSSNGAHQAEVVAMNVAVAIDEVGHEALPTASEAGPAPKRIVVAYGFWIFLLSDIVMFSALFAGYAVLVHATAGGPTGAQLFNQAQRRDRDGLPACLELHLRTDVVGDQFAAPCSRTYFFAADHLRARRRVPRSRDPRVRRHDRHRRDSATQRVSFRVLHACRLPRAARHAPD